MCLDTYNVTGQEMCCCNALTPSVGGSHFLLRGVGWERRCVFGALSLDIGLLTRSKRGSWLCV